MITNSEDSVLIALEMKLGCEKYSNRYIADRNGIS